jgi:hypothetical protein
MSAAIERSSRGVYLTEEEQQQNERDRLIFASGNAEAVGQRIATLQVKGVKA